MEHASARVAPSASPPLFAQVRDALRGQILAGGLRPGDRLPSEAALVERFGVSRITVRQALAELQSSGLVQTVNGKGSYVTPPGRSEALGPFVGVLEAMRKRGHRARGRMLSHREVDAPARVARELDVPAGTRLGAVTVLRFRDDVPFAVGTSWCDTTTAARLAAQDLVGNDVALVIASNLGLRSARTRVVVGARLADARLARRLRCEPGSAVLHVRTTMIGHDGRALVYSETDCRADMMDYRVTLRG